MLAVVLSFFTLLAKDMQQAKLLVLANFGQVEDRVKVMAALQGAVVLSAAVLFGNGGVKLTFNRGLRIEAAVFVTQTFKVEQPDLTALLRVACANGWLAVARTNLKGRGRKPSLLLRGEDEVIQGFGKTRVKLFNRTDFVRWVTKTCLDQKLSARVSAAS